MVNVNVGGIYSNATINYGPWNAALKQMSTNVNSAMGKTNVATGNVAKGFNTASKSVRQFSENVWTARGSIKDFTRVATGILMAQFFYKGIVTPIKEAITALWDFNSMLETTQVSFKYLMQANKEEVAGFIDQLEELAALTPYTFETATKGAQRLLALGFSEKQLLPMLRMMADLNAATGGGADQMEALAYAFGKVQAMGKMTTRELRLFVTANIPIYKILREELGLTEKDFMKLRISASDAIPAILRGIQKFKGAADEAQKTIPGLLSSIHDYLLFLGQDILASMWETLRGTLSKIRDFSAQAHEAFKLGGAENLLATMLPPNMALLLWQLVNILKQVWQSMVNIWRVTAPLRMEFMNMGLVLTRVVLIGLASLAKILSIVSGATMQNIPLVRTLSAALWGLLVAEIVSQSLKGLIIAIRALGAVSFTTVSIISLIIGALVALALTIPSVQMWFINLGKRISSIFGIEVPTSIYKTIQMIKPLTGGEMNFQDLIDSFSDIGDEAETAGKKIKDTFLASFDEVYAIPDKLDDAANIGNLLKDFVVPDMSWQDTGTGALDIIDDKLNKFSLTWKTIWDVILTSLPHIKNMFMIVFDAIGKILALIIPKIATTLLTYLPVLITSIVTLAMTIVAVLGNILPKVIATVAILLARAITKYILPALFDSGSNIHKVLFKLINIIGDSVVTLLISTIVQLSIIALRLLNTLTMEISELAKKIALKLMQFGTMMNLLPLIWQEGYDSFYYEVNKQNKNIATAFDKMFPTELPIFGVFDKKMEDAGIEASKYFTDGLTQHMNDTLPAFNEAMAGLQTDIAKDSVETKKQVDAIWAGTPEQLKSILAPALKQVSDMNANWANTVFLPLWANTGTQVVSILTETGKGLTSEADSMMKDITTVIDNAKVPISNSLNNILGGTGPIYAALHQGKNIGYSLTAGILKGITENSGAIYAALHMGAMGAGGTYKYKVPTNLPGYASGGIINKPQLASLGEKGTKETVTPLTKEGVLPWAQAIVASMGGQTNTTNAEYTMVKMKTADLVNLERQLFTIRKGETFRVAGRTA